MANNLNTPQRERLARVLELLGSSHAGECEAVSLAAQRIIRHAELQWRDMLVLPASVPTPSSQCDAPSRPPPSREPSSVKELLGITARHRDHSTDWEKRFAVNVARQRGASPKQYAILVRIAERVLR